jgi:hypothetical protein
MTMSSHQSGRSVTDVWLTPPEWIEALGGASTFDLDPCAAPTAPEPWPTALKHYREQDTDGLTAPWFGRCWVNPPFDNRVVGKWVANLAEHGIGTLLVPARTETAYWRESIWGRASSVLFVGRRPHFHRVDGSRAAANSGVPVALVAYGEDDAAVLVNCGIPGAYVGEWSMSRAGSP